MGYFNFENSPSEKTPLSAENLLAMQRGLMELVFPIGSTYITQSDTNPNSILGFGTWERFKGMVAVGLDENDADKYFDEIGKTGGEKKHTQTIDELAAHNHSLSRSGAVLQGGYTALYNNNGSKELGFNTENAGKSTPFNITQPYEVVGYMWIRRS